MGNRHLHIGNLTSRISRISCGLAVALLSGPVSGDVLSAPEMFEQMRGSLSFVPNASMDVQVVSDIVWSDGLGSANTPWSTTVSDVWTVQSDDSRIGMELYRKAPEESKRTRIVYAEDARRTFVFHSAAHPDAPELGELMLTSLSDRDYAWRMPSLEYMDRVFRVQGRFSRSSLYFVGDKQQPVDGHLCIVVQGSSNSRDITLWLDPEYGYLPRKYELLLDHGREEMGRRGGPPPPRPPIAAPPAWINPPDLPLTTVEKMSGVTLGQVNGRSYLSKAVVDRTKTYARGISCVEHTKIDVTSFLLTVAPNAKAFLEMEGLLRDGTPVEERIEGGRFAPDIVNYYAMKNGQFASTTTSLRTYIAQIVRDFERLKSDFNMENLKRIDSTFIIVVCAVAALLINGGIAYASYRKNRAKPS